MCFDHFLRQNAIFQNFENYIHDILVNCSIKFDIKRRKNNSYEKVLMSVFPKLSNSKRFIFNTFEKNEIKEG